MMTVAKVGLTVDITASDASLARAVWLVNSGILAPQAAADAEGVSVDAAMGIGVDEDDAVRADVVVGAK